MENISTTIIIWEKMFLLQGKQMKKIYISTDYEGHVRGVFLAESRELVDVFHLGAGDPIHSIEEIDITDPELDKFPLVTLITSYEKNGYDLNNKAGEKYIFVKRGR